jgi:hypothetical protein
VRARFVLAAACSLFACAPRALPPPMTARWFPVEMERGRVTFELPEGMVLSPYADVFRPVSGRLVRRDGRDTTVQWWEYREESVLTRSYRALNFQLALVTPDEYPIDAESIRRLHAAGDDVAYDDMLAVLLRLLQGDVPDYIRNGGRARLGPHPAWRLYRDGDPDFPEIRDFYASAVAPDALLVVSVLMRDIATLEERTQVVPRILASIRVHPSSP